MDYWRFRDWIFTFALGAAEPWIYTISAAAAGAVAGLELALSTLFG